MQTEPMEPDVELELCNHEEAGVQIEEISSGRKTRGETLNTNVLGENWRAWQRYLRSSLSEAGAIVNGAIVSDGGLVGMLLPGRYIESRSID